jgi:hypothetical protein
MKLLVITQKIDIDDDILGFFHRWVEKFAENLDRVYVICLWEGKHSLPRNVKVYLACREMSKFILWARKRDIQKFANFSDYKNLFLEISKM